jgi:hypothetical protein
MDKFIALVLGFVAWSGVVALALAVTFNMGDKNQVLMFLPILAAVFAAWGVGEVVTQRVLAKKEDR